MSSLTKLEIALSQLHHAIELYLEDREPVSAVTLAGAAEEILGKLCELNGRPSSLSRKISTTRTLFRALWKKDVAEKSIASLRNARRNEMKHLISGAPITIDVAAEASRMIARAVENYTSLCGREAPKMRQFQRKRLKSYELRGV